MPVDYREKTWLVAPYGPVSWVQNARASRQVTLQYGRTKTNYAIREVGAAEAAPVLKRYIAVATKTRPQFDAKTDSPVEDFIAEAERHPVFELTPL